MLKLLKLFIFVVIVAPITFAAVLYFTPERIDFSKYQPQMEDYILEKSGYRVSLGDNLKIRVFPSPHISSDNVVVHAFRGEKPLFTAEKVSLDLTLDNLLAMKVGVDKLLVKSPKVYLYKGIKGEGNWEPKRKRRTSSKAVDLSFISGLGEVLISNADVVMEDDQHGNQFKLQSGQFSIAGENLRQTKVNIAGVLNGVEIESQLNMDISNIVEISVMGDVQVAESKVTLKGFIDDLLLKPSYNGEMNFEGESLLTTVYDVLHVAPNQRTVDLPLKLVGIIDVSSDYLKLDNYSVSVAVSPTPVEFFVTSELWFNKQNQNTVNLSTVDKLNLETFKVCQQQQGAAKKSGDIEWSQELMDLTPLKNLKIVMDIDVLKGFTCQGYDVKYAKLRSSIDEGVVKVSQFKLEMSQGGDIRGTASLDTRGTPRGGIDITSNNLNVANLKAVEKQQRVKLPLDGMLQVDFSGKTVHEWVSGLQGKMMLNSDGLVLYGVSLSSLNNMLSNVFMDKLTGQAKSEDYGKFSMTGSIEDGVLKSENISLLLADADVIAKGKVDLVRMTMNFKAEPNPENQLGFKTPVLIKGSVFSPAVIPVATTSQKVGAAVGGAVGGPAGAALGGVLGAIMESGPKRQDVSSTELNGDEIMKEKQRLQEEVLKFLQTR